MSAYDIENVHSTFDLMTLIAARKIGNPKWEPFRFEHVKGGTLLWGCTPTGAVNRGKNKGRKKWNRDEAEKVIVSRFDVSVERARYEKETGRCSQCFGKGKMFMGWDHEKGMTYRDCTRCYGSGKAQ